MRLNQLLANLLVFLSFVNALPKGTASAADDALAAGIKFTPRGRDLYQDLVLSYQSQIAGAIQLNIIWNQAQEIFTTYQSGLQISTQITTFLGITNLYVIINGEVALADGAQLNFNDWTGTAFLDADSGSISYPEIVFDGVSVTQGVITEGLNTTPSIDDQGSSSIKPPDVGTASP